MRVVFNMFLIVMSDRSSDPLTPGGCEPNLGGCEMYVCESPTEQLLPPTEFAMLRVLKPLRILLSNVAKIVRRIMNVMESPTNGLLVAAIQPKKRSNAV